MGNSCDTICVSTYETLIWQSHDHHAFGVTTEEFTPKAYYSNSQTRRAQSEEKSLGEKGNGEWGFLFQLPIASLEGSRDTPFPPMVTCSKLDSFYLGDPIKMHRPPLVNRH